MKDVTAEQVKEAMLVKGISYVPHHECGGCNYMTHYTCSGESLFFHPGCDCGRYNWPELRDWQEAADWINMQSVEASKEDIARRFGIDV